MGGIPPTFPQRFILCYWPYGLHMLSRVSLVPEKRRLRFGSCWGRLLTSVCLASVSLAWSFFMESKSKSPAPNASLFLTLRQCTSKGRFHRLAEHGNDGLDNFVDNAATHNGYRHLSPQHIQVPGTVHPGGEMQKASPHEHPGHNVHNPGSQPQPRQPESTQSRSVRVANHNAGWP